MGLLFFNTVVADVVFKILMGVFATGPRIADFLDLEDERLWFVSIRLVEARDETVEPAWLMASRRLRLSASFLFISSISGVTIGVLKREEMKWR